MVERKQRYQRCKTDKMVDVKEQLREASAYTLGSEIPGNILLFPILSITDANLRFGLLETEGNPLNRVIRICFVCSSGSVE